MNLYILRHAIAVERDPLGMEDDSKRELTSKGAAKMRRIATGMLAMGLQFDLILSSPYLRTRQTADIVADVFDVRERLRFTENLTPGTGAEKVIEEVLKHYKKKENILLVGHEPMLSTMISILISGEPTLPITMKKAGLCCLTIPVLSYGRCAVLEWLLQPSQLAKLEKG